MYGSEPMQKLYETLDNALGSSSKTTNIIVMGDSNAQIGKI